MLCMIFIISAITICLFQLLIRGVVLKRFNLMKPGGTLRERPEREEDQIGGPWGGQRESPEEAERETREEDQRRSGIHHHISQLSQGPSL